MIPAEQILLRRAAFLLSGWYELNYRSEKLGASRMVDIDGGLFDEDARRCAELVQQADLLVADIKKHLQKAVA